MSHQRHRRVVGASKVLVLILLPAGMVQAACTSVPAAQSQAACPLPVPFRAQNFAHSLAIDNQYLPLRPGSQREYRGTVAGKPGTHTIVFTVTDLAKVIDGVRSRVVYDVDKDGDKVSEAELSFWAQDEAGNVWNVGEYPEEYDNGKFTGAPSTWLAHEARASAGIHMLADPTDPSVFGKEYLQGRAPTIDFLDCATVKRMENDPIQVAAGPFAGVLLTEERSPLASATAIQTKEYAPQVGIVRIAAKNDPKAETLELVQNPTLSQAELASVDDAVRGLDRHAHQVSKVYAGTAPVEVG